MHEVGENSYYKYKDGEKYPEFIQDPAMEVVHIFSPTEMIPLVEFIGIASIAKGAFKGVKKNCFVIEKWLY